MAHSEGSAQLVRLEGKVGGPARLYKVGLAAPEIRGDEISSTKRRGDERKIRSEQLDCLEPFFLDSQ
jgi:hypothetical protein